MESSARSIIVFCLLTVVHMASLCYYSPFPPRAWSRVQHPCTFASETAEQMEAAQMLRKPMDAQMLRKGNVLQHKGNSARLTKTQRYAQLARGGGPNRTKVFATQTQTYSNPNTRMMQRIGAEVYPYPNNVVGAPNNPSGPFEVNASSPFDCSNNTLLDGGSLVCGTLVDPCTGKVLKSNEASPWMCSPASASNVPGASLLCWDSRIQSWFPREKKVMSNSGTKWPTNYKGFQTADDGLLSSALYTLFLASPTIQLLSVMNDTIHLTFSHGNLFDIDGYNVYVNNVLVKQVPDTGSYVHPLSVTEIEEAFNSIGTTTTIATKSTSAKETLGKSAPSQTQDYVIAMTTVTANQESMYSNPVVIKQSNGVLPTPIPTPEPTKDAVEQALIDISHNLVQFKQELSDQLNNVNNSVYELKVDVSNNFQVHAINSTLLDIVSTTSTIMAKMVDLKCCTCDTSCNCAFYNAIFNHPAIHEINGFVMHYISLAHEDSTFMIDLDTYNRLNIDLANLELLFECDESDNLITLYKNMLFVVYHAFEDKYLKQSTLVASKKWEQDSIILNDREKLKEYLETLNNNYTLINLTITSLKLNVRPQYAIYHERYGVPQHLEYNPKLLEGILIELGLRTEQPPAAIC